MLWKIVMILGILGTLLGFLVAIVSFALVPLTNGRTSMSEAMLGIIPGLIVGLISFFIFLIGLILVIRNRKKAGDR